MSKPVSSPARNNNLIAKHLLPFSYRLRWVGAECAQHCSSIPHRLNLDRHHDPGTDSLWRISPIPCLYDTLAVRFQSRHKPLNFGRSRSRLPDGLASSFTSASRFLSAFDPGLCGRMAHPLTLQSRE